MFRVRAKNKHGWSAWSRISKACSTSTILPPGVPSLNEAGATWLDVHWSPAPNGGVVKYEVQYREATAPVWRGGAVSEWRVLEGRDELRDDRVVLPDLKPQKAYECRVREHGVPLEREGPDATFVGLLRFQIRQHDAVVAQLVAPD